MARWKAHVDFLLTVSELLFLSLTVDALQGKTCQNSLLFGWGESVWAKISEEGVVPGEYFLVSRKLDILLIWQCKLHRATCSHFDTIPACDRRTEGIAIASTALAMRALRRAVKSCGTQAQLRGGIGRLCNARTGETGTATKTVNDLVLDQEDKSQTHRTVRKIPLETGIHRSSVSWCKGNSFKVKRTFLRRLFKLQIISYTTKVL